MATLLLFLMVGAVGVVGAILYMLYGPTGTVLVERATQVSFTPPPFAALPEPVVAPLPVSDAVVEELDAELEPDELPVPARVVALMPVPRLGVSRSQVSPRSRMARGSASPPIVPPPVDAGTARPSS